MVDFFALEMVVAFETNALASSEEGEGAKAGAIGLDGEGVELGHEAPFTSELLDGNVDALSPGVGFSSVGQFGSGWLIGSVLVNLELEGSLFIFADTVEMIFKAAFRNLAKRRIFSREMLVLFEDGIEDATLESGLILISGIDALDLAEDTGEEIDGTFLHGGGDGAIGVVRMDVARDAATSEKGAGDKRGDGAAELTIGVVSVAEDLVDGSTAGLSFAVGLCGCEGGGSAIEVGVDAIFIGANVVDSAHDKELVRERFERSHGAIEAFRLERSGDAEAEEEVEGANGNFGSLDRFGEGHFLEKRKADSGAGKGAEEMAAVHGEEVIGLLGE